MWRFHDWKLGCRNQFPSLPLEGEGITSMWSTERFGLTLKAVVIWLTCRLVWIAQWISFIKEDQYIHPSGSPTMCWIYSWPTHFILAMSSHAQRERTPFVRKLDWFVELIQVEPEYGRFENKISVSNYLFPEMVLQIRQAVSETCRFQSKKIGNFTMWF